MRKAVEMSMANAYNLYCTVVQYNLYSTGSERAVVRTRYADR